MSATLPHTEMSPLHGPIPAQVPLSKAPLVRVIAQIKFSEVLGVESPELVADFQDAISHSYASLIRESGFNSQMPGIGMHLSPPMTHWRFSDHPVDWQWRVTLTSQFITLESTQYTSRDDFIERLQVILEAVEEHIKPAMMIRLGIRYINRILGKELQDLSLLVRPEIAGVVGTSMANSIYLSLSETVFDLEGKKMTARWGMVPSGVTVDPSTTLPIDEPSFLIDLDVFEEIPSGFQSGEITIKAKLFAERSYAFFRWAVTDEFLLRFGA
ncbi:TIGR04255 family protein [Polynucleobacter rarus]|jgi:uncharacterized protein (TIGR04255 family)|uniref:TIGR04255 family protein n=1 Tax=Polynucleobacter rarus TaxID=556055 RepID=UPI000D3EBA69|nr:TIGR04255 family protein [Polynucleobacter rarus]